ncbi:hypothetical protein I3843_16G089400 [Carya illinoinensis]|nr:hypothetical protein I3843_16G089400 [Carya illinoinensis]KAG7942211.1 hypothetical protein I3843_16G089400 [Carya illinoinensis]
MFYNYFTDTVHFTTNQGMFGLSAQGSCKRAKLSTRLSRTLTFMLHSLDSEELIEFAVVTWSLWKRRNDFFFQKRFLTPNRLLKQISQRIQDLKAISLAFPIQQTLTPVHRCVWVAPPKAIMKINWDVAVDKNTSKICVGATVRDWEGHVLATMRLNISLFSRSIVCRNICCPSCNYSGD